jgi:hypothetical protein
VRDETGPGDVEQSRLHGPATPEGLQPDSTSSTRGHPPHEAPCS